MSWTHDDNQLDMWYGLGSFECLELMLEKLCTQGVWWNAWMKTSVRTF